MVIETHLEKIECAKTNDKGDLCIIMKVQKLDNFKSSAYFKIECNMDSLIKQYNDDSPPTLYNGFKGGIDKFNYISAENKYVIYFYRFKIENKNMVLPKKDYNIDILNKINIQEIVVDKESGYGWSMQVTYFPDSADYKSVNFIIPTSYRNKIWPFFVLPFAFLLDLAILPFEIIGIIIEIMNDVGYNLSKNRTGYNGLF